MYKVLVLDGLSDEGVTKFKEAGFETDIRGPQKLDELKAIIDDYDGLVVRSGTTVSAEALANCKRLKVIGRAGVGTDNIDKEAATQAGIVVMNTPGGNTISTCEHTFALLLALCRRIPAAHASMEAGRWDRKLFQGSELCGKVLGVIGLGRIGGEVTKRALAFDMKVIAFDPIMTQLKADALGVELVSVEELLKRADFVTVHAPKSDKTNNMIGAAQLKTMKPTARIVNCARGGIINEKDLAEALKNNVIGGAALDVYTKEPFDDNPFIGLENIVTTPHLAASTDEAQLTVAVDVAVQMVDYLTTGAISNAVNVPSLDAELRAKLKPLLDLAEALGDFQSQYMEGRPQRIEIIYNGDLDVSDTYPITTSIIMGFLKSSVENVNMVSAPAQLKERGIEISETHGTADSDYAFEIAVHVTTDEQDHTIKGTLFQGVPRICGVDGMHVDAKPSGEMLLCINDDVPMIIGQVCMIIGEANVNIANLTLGRSARGGKALTLLSLDEKLSEETMEKIRQIPHVLQAGTVTLPVMD